MKQKIGRLAGCLLFILICFFFVFQLGIITRPAKTEKNLAAVNAFHSMPQNSFEVIGFGSSQLWKGLDPLAMYESCGIGSYNYGCNWQQLPTTGLFIYDAFTVQSPKLVIIEALNVNEPISSVTEGEAFYTRALPASPAKERYLEQYFGGNHEKELSYYIPVLRFHENWQHLDKNSFSYHKNLSLFTDFFKQTLGYHPYHGKTLVTFADEAENSQARLSEGAAETLLQIVRFCQSRGAKVLFVNMPSSQNYLFEDDMREFASENHCDYLNLLHHVEGIGLDPTADFYDYTHLNQSGAAKVSRYLGEYISSHYTLTDFRQLENNLWEQALLNPPDFDLP